MADVVKEVKTVFTLEDKLSSGLQHVSEASNKTGQAIHGVVEHTSVLQASMSSVGSSISGLVSSALSPLNLALGAIAGTLSVMGIAKVGSDFEQMQIQLAQTMKFMGQGGGDFHQAMSMAADQMQRIVADAGPLPGEASAYMEAMSLAGTTVQEATGNYENSYQLIKSMTAVLGGDGVTAANNLNRALQAGHGHLVQQEKSHQQLLQYMRQTEGNKGLTIQSFNAKSLADRLKIVNETTALFKDKIDALTNTWDAQYGAIKSTSELLMQNASAPLFAAMKDGLSWVNSALIDEKGHWTDLGNSIISTGHLISQHIIKGVHQAVDAFQEMERVVRRIGETPFFLAMGRAGASLMAGGGEGHKAGGGEVAGQTATQGMLDTVRNNFDNFVNSLGDKFSLLEASLSRLTVLWDPLMNFISATSNYLSSLSDVVGGVLLETFDTIVATLVPMIDALFSFGEALFDAVAPFVQTILPPVMAVFNHLAFVIGGIFTEAINFVTDTLKVLTPSLNYLWESIGPLITTLGTLLVDAAHQVGDVFHGLWQALSTYVVPVFQALAIMLGALMRALNFLISWALKKAGEETGTGVGDATNGLLPNIQSASHIQAVAPGATAPGHASSMADRIAKSLANAGKSQETLAGGSSTPDARGGGGGVTQDFRYSRFDISQKFEEGFDPDRIAVAFADDLSRAGEHKLQSGFAPLMGLR